MRDISNLDEPRDEMARSNGANITVLHTKDIDKASQLVSKRAYSWLYLGKEVKQREKISQVLGVNNRYFIEGLLHEVAHQLKQPFLDFVAELGRYQKNKLHWWASNIAYKCPLTSDFFLLQCYATIFEKFYSDNKCRGGKTLIVFIEDCWLYRYLWQRYKKEALGLCFLSKISVLLEILNSALRAIISRGYFLLKTGIQIWKSRNIAGQSKTSDLIGNEKEIYIYSWIEDRFFKKDGEVENAYFGRLQEIVNDCGLNVTYITPPFLEPDLKRKCLDYGKCKFVFLDQYINLRSTLKSLFPFLRISFPEELDGQLPSSKILLQREIVHEFSSFPSNILYYSAFKKLLKEVKQRELVVIYPFENQPWEKMLCLAASERGENIKLVGYQHSVLPLLLINCFLGAGESSDMPLPHILVANGEHTLNLLKNARYGETELVNGGALRYEYLLKRNKHSIIKSDTSKTVLITLDYLRVLTEELLISVFAAFKDLTEEKIKFIVKFHPNTPLESLKIRLPTWPSHFQKTSEPISEILKKVDLVIYSSSTVGVEAAISGIPVIKYYSENVLDLDPLDGFNGQLIRSCSDSNLKQAVLSALSIGDTGQEPILNPTKLNGLFSPVNEDVWRQIVRR